VDKIETYVCVSRSGARWRRSPVAITLSACRIASGMAAKSTASYGSSNGKGRDGCPSRPSVAVPVGETRRRLSEAWL
jgi:hypothetical protein